MKTARVVALAILAALILLSLAPLIRAFSNGKERVEVMSSKCEAKGGALVVEAETRRLVCAMSNDGS